MRAGKGIPVARLFLAIALGWSLGGCAGFGTPHLTDRGLHTREPERGLMASSATRETGWADRIRRLPFGSRAEAGQGKPKPPLSGPAVGEGAARGFDSGSVRVAAQSPAEESGSADSGRVRLETLDDEPETLPQASSLEEREAKGGGLLRRLLQPPKLRPVPSLRDVPQPSVENVRGPLQRSLQGELAREPQDSPRGAVGTPTDEKRRVLRELMEAEYVAARKLFDSGRYEEAETLFLRLAERGRAKWYELGKRLAGQDAIVKEVAKKNPFREDALFYAGECAFQRERYREAVKRYETVMAEFPSTIHMETITRRFFSIAQLWLGFRDFVTTEEIQPVSFDSERGVPVERAPSGEREPPGLSLMPNFTDPSRPITDTRGHALRLLRKIWMNDPTGPVADDALMLAASYHLRRGNYLEADRLFGILREEYPKSPHLEAAFVLGSHVKLMAYQGPAYDATQLDDAERLKSAALRLFPDSDERQRLQKELQLIREAKAQREWERVRFYEKKRRTQAMVVYARELLRLYPDTSFAPKALEVLRTHAPAIAARYEAVVRREQRSSEGGISDVSGMVGNPDDLADRDDETTAHTNE